MKKFKAKRKNNENGEYDEEYEPLKKWYDDVRVKVLNNITEKITRKILGGRRSKRFRVGNRTSVN